MSALLIVGHGTRDDAGAEDFRGFVRRVGELAAARGAADAVGGGFIELSPPPLKDAVTGLVEAGHRELTAVPLILLAAGHAKGDIPAALARERERHPGLRTRYARPLGPHPVVLDLLRRRFAEHTAALAADDAGAAAVDAVLLVGRGTTDPDANADLYRAARLLWETTRDLGVRQVEAAFVSLAHPSVPEGLDRLRTLGARRIAVLPFFLFRGVLPERIHAQAAQWSARHPDGPRATVADVIGDCDELAGLVLERFAEADGRGAAPAGMNCDACVYRIALPGFESRVGQEQRPHDHPHDPAHAHAPGHAHGPAHTHDLPVPGQLPAHGHPHVRTPGQAVPGSGSSHVQSVPETRISAPVSIPSPPMG